MRASRIIVILIIVNVVLGGLAASVILSPEYYALGQAIRKGKSLPLPPERVRYAVMAAERPWFVTGSTRGALREIFGHAGHRLWLTAPQPCRRFCRVRRVIVIGLRRFSESDETMLRAYIATVDMGTVNGRAISGLQEAAPAYLLTPQLAVGSWRLAGDPRPRHAGVVPPPTANRQPSTGQRLDDEELATLELPQCAMLAGMILSPNAYSPAFPERSLRRRNFVLKRMMDEKFISLAEYERAVAAPLSGLKPALRHSALPEPGS